MEVLLVAADAGADVLVLCDTNGGMLPSRLPDVVGEVVGHGLRVGIHAHDDIACATDAVTRVLVETSDGGTQWSTVGVHENVIEASWQALEQAYTAGLLKQA